MMKKGIPASKGYAKGTAFVVEIDEVQASGEKAASPAMEKERLQIAVESARKQLNALLEKTRLEMGEGPAAIIGVQLQMLDDPEFTGKALTNIEMNPIGAERAIREVMDMFIGIFSDLEDEYLRERVADVKDVGTRILQNLAGKVSNRFAGLPDNAIIVAHDLTPSDTAQIDKNKVVAFVTDIGGPTSHSAIMARTLEIPAVVGLGDITGTVKMGDTVIVDGIAGTVMMNPDEATMNVYRNKKDEYERDKNTLKSLIHTETITKSGRHIIVAANIGKPEDVEKAVKNGAEGIGLFRTEFLYMDREQLPTELEQFEAYKQVARSMKGKPVVIRTLDIGGDKKLAYLPLPEEMNPFLGLRAIRLCLERKDLFKPQLRALLRASAYGNVQIMFPMIGSSEEFLEAKGILQECMMELKQEEIAFNEEVPVGIMIEIPSAALSADALAKEADFFSIGTNDLIQYTLAVDRMNENVSHLYNPMHPAVLQLIKMTIAAAHKEGKWCGMCGEMAGDAHAIPTLIEYGLDEFSMSASSLLEAKKVIITC
jgi:phosphoenolpyruvate-protein phosphotransferase (PTS system enzyme I)